MDLSARCDVPMFAGQRLAGKTVCHPVGDQNWWERTKVGRWHVSNGMTRLLVDDQLLRTLKRLDQIFGMLKGAQLVPFAGDAEIRHSDLVGVALPGDGLAKFVAFGLLGNA